MTQEFSVILVLIRAIVASIVAFGHVRGGLFPSYPRCNHWRSRLDCLRCNNFTRYKSGINIGDGAVIGAGSVVTRSIEPYTIVAGSPARVIGQRSPTLSYQLNYFPWLM